MKQSKIAPRLRNVPCNLRLQRLRIRPARFVTQAMQEGQAQRRVLRKRDRFKAKNMRFNGEGIFAEGRAIADIGDGIEAARVCAFANRHAGHVDAVGGQQFAVVREVDGGHGIARAVAAARRRRADDGDRALQQLARVADATGSDRSQTALDFSEAR